MTHERPVVFLAFANAPDAHLDLLKTESREIYRALQPLEGEGKIAVHREESSEFDELYEDLLTHDQRIVVFHYAGHADGTMLQLEGGAGGAEGLARLLGQQSSLKLVFLNGCATKGHVTLLLKAGIPAVIATSIPIGDRKAQEFATAFYSALAEGRSISQAFDSGSAYVEGKHSDSDVSFSRSLSWEEDEEEEDAAVLEWGLYTGKDCAEVIEQWRLPDAQSEWQLQLTDSRGALRNLDGSPQLIEHRSRTRTVDAIRCQNCGTASSALSDDASKCPICSSDNVETGSAHTVIADQVLPFVVTEDDARRQLLDYAGDDAKVIFLNRVFVPYWIFDLDTRTTFEAERGITRDFTAVPPKVEWEPVKDEIDLAFDSYLVPAGATPVGRDSTAHDWYWELDQAEALERIDTGTASIPLDRSMQSAFDQIASNQDLELEGEIAERVGGHQQRNVSTDTRYRNVSARTILLPHWYASVDLEEGQTGLLLNGQSGAVRPLRLPGTIQLQNGSTTPMTKRTYEPSGQQPGTSLAVSVFSGAGIGLMVGGLLGLALSPTINAFIAAIGVVLAALLGLNDRHFSASKGLRIGAFGVFVILGGVAGLYTKYHSVFAPSLLERKEAFMGAGFSECQALDMLAGLSLRLRPPEYDSGLDERKEEFISAGFSECQALSLLAGRTAAAVIASEESGGDATKQKMSAIDQTVSGAGFMATPFDQDACDTLESLTYPSDISLARVRISFEDTNNESWTKWSVSVGESSLSDDEKRELLFVGREAVCRIQPRPRIDCARLQKMAKNNSSELSAAFGETDEFVRIRDSIVNEISPASDQALALSLLTDTLCGDSE